MRDEYDFSRGIRRGALAEMPAEARDLLLRAARDILELGMQAERLQQAILAHKQSTLDRGDSERPQDTELWKRI